MTFLRQLQGELKKLFARKRTYIGYVVFLIFEALLLSLWIYVGARTIRGSGETKLHPG